jgi:hypothetical protein
MATKEPVGKEEFETITFNLSVDNIKWLKLIDEKMQRRSVSNTLNFILNNLRERKNIGMNYGE